MDFPGEIFVSRVVLCLVSGVVANVVLYMERIPELKSKKVLPSYFDDIQQIHQTESKITIENTEKFPRFWLKIVIFLRKND